VPRVQKTVFIFLLMMLPCVAFSQNLHLIDSLKTKLKGKDGKAKFDLLNDLAWEYRFAYPDSTIFFGNQALHLGESLNLSRGLARPLNFIGVAYNYKGERVKAFDFYSKALEMANLQRDSIQTAHANNNLGRLFYDQGILGRSYDYFVKARSIFIALNDSSGLAYTYQSLANLYKSQRDYPKAENNYLNAYYLRLALGNPRDIMAALMYLGRHYLESKEIDKSIKYFQLADSTGRIINDEINLAEIKTFLAENFLAKGLLKEAESICKDGLNVILKKNNYRMMPQAYNTLGQIYLQQNELATAKRYFNMALDFSNKMQDLNAKMNSYFFLWKVSERMNSTQESIANHNEYLILKDSLKDLDVARQVERLQFEIEIQRKEQENELLKVNEAKNSAVIQQQRLENIVLIVVVVFISSVVFLQWRFNNKNKEINEKLLHQNEEIQKQRAEIIDQNEKLSKRNQQLSDLNHEKDTLMSIVAHDLKSPLNRIEGLITLIEMDNRSGKNFQAYLDMLRDATRSGLDLITDLLDVHMLEENVEPNYSTFDISTFLLEKTETFRSRAEAKKIHLNITRVENEEVFTDHDYLDRIFDNLLSNAIKFSPRNSVVDIAADRTQHEFWISVKDKGPGFSTRDQEFMFQKFRKLSARPTGGETSNGLGLAIVKILADRLKGKIELNTESGKGSEFIVRFPQQKQYA
jgi:signal transduction histidine kinase